MPSMVVTVQLPYWFVVLLLVLSLSNIPWIVAEAVRRISVKGSPHRYQWASVEHALRYPAMTGMGLQGLFDFGVMHWYLGAAVSVVGLALQVWLLIEKHNGDDDDDYWSDLKKRLSEGRLAPSGA